MQRHNGNGIVLLIVLLGLASFIAKLIITYWYVILLLVLVIAVICWAVWKWERSIAMEQEERQRLIAMEQEERQRLLAETRRLEAEQRQQAEIRELREFLAKHQDLVDKFCEVAERRVSVRDEYGEESWSALPRQIDFLLRKLREREAELPERLVPYLSPWERNCPLRNTYGAQTRGILEDIFREYHASQAARPTCSVDCSQMAGVEFETYLARVLLEEGFDEVTGTPATGDQGADIIAKINGKKLVIQAKRYAGTVGNKAVQEVIVARSFYAADEAWVITNSTFTRSARALAQKSNVKLIDGQALAKRDFSLT